MHDGRIVQQATPAELYAAPGRPVGGRVRRRRQPRRRRGPGDRADHRRRRRCPWPQPCHRTGRPGCCCDPRSSASGPATRPRSRSSSSTATTPSTWCDSTTASRVRVQGRLAARLPAGRPGRGVLRRCPDGRLRGRHRALGDAGGDRRRVIAVIGAGPAGLALAWRAARAGHEVVVARTPRATSAAWPPASRSPACGSTTAATGCTRRSTPPILAALRGLLGDDLQTRPRHGRIRLADRWVAFPLRPDDLVRRLPPRFAAGAGRRRG